MSELPLGFMQPEEDAALEELARDRWVLEIGSYLGHSTVVMARVAARLMAVDWHRGDQFTAGVSPGLDTLRPYFDNLEAAGLREKVISVVGELSQVGPLLASDSFHFAFVDASHDFASVLNDGLLALRCVRSGGLVAFHDYQPGFPDVIRAVDQLGQRMQTAIQPSAGALVLLVKPANAQYTW